MERASFVFYVCRLHGWVAGTSLATIKISPRIFSSVNNSKAAATSSEPVAHLGLAAASPCRAAVSLAFARDAVPEFLGPWRGGGRRGCRRGSRLIDALWAVALGARRGQRRGAPRLPAWFLVGSPGPVIAAMACGPGSTAPVDLRIYSRWPAGCPGARVQRAIILGLLVSLCR